MSTALRLPSLRTRHRDEEAAKLLHDAGDELDLIDEILAEQEQIRARSPGESRCSIGRSPAADW